MPPSQPQPPFAIVTDSTAYLPAEMVKRYGITVVPLSVVIGDQVYDEGADVTAALRRRRAVSTSRPSPEAFAEAYRAASEAGAREVLSLHLSAELSGTCEAARLAASSAPLPVRVVDTRMVAMALGFSVLTAAQVGAAGGAADEA